VAVHSKLWYLQRFKLIDALEEPQRKLLEETTRMQEVKRGQRIYQAGDPSQHFFLVKRGVIKIAAIGPSNREVLLSFRHRGDVFSELALLDDSPRDHLAKAHEDSLICALNRDVILRLARESPDVGFRVLTMMGRRVEQFRGRIEQLSYKSAAAGIARALIDLAEEHGVQDSRGTVIAFKLSQRDLADLVGLTRETVNVILHDLQQEGLIEGDRRVIRVLDSDRLRTVQ
jgi:CRP/FNR family transcriptional regulator, cyclic AMP receptor protein